MTLASIDIGTNTVLLLIARTSGNVKTIEVLTDVYRIPRLGRGLLPGKPIPEDNLLKFYDILREYKNIIDEYNCSHIISAATMAFRQASNSHEVVEYVKRNIGIDINIISGKEESELAYLGAVYDYDSDSDNLVIDIGGGSTELIKGTGREIFYNESFNIGVVSSWEKFRVGDRLNILQLEKHLNSIFHLPSEHTRAPGRAIAVAGTPTTLACMKMNLKNFEEKKVEGKILTLKDLHLLKKQLDSMTPKEILLNYNSVVSGREDLILSGTCILLYIMNIYNITEVIVSTKGIRYGLIYRWLASN